MTTETQKAHAQTPDMRSGSTKGWLIDVLVGGFAGGVAGAIVAVNIVIFSGIDDGYESSFGDIMDYSPVLGLAVVGVLVTVPVFGVVTMRKLRRLRQQY